MACGCASQKSADGRSVTCGCSELGTGAVKGERLEIPGRSTTDPSSIPCGVGEPAGLVRAIANLRPRETNRGPTQLTSFGAFAMDSHGNAFHGLTGAIRQAQREGRWQQLLGPPARALRPAGSADSVEPPCACSRQDAALLLPQLAAERFRP